MVSYNGVRVFGSRPGGKEGLAESDVVCAAGCREGDGAEADVFASVGFGSDAGFCCEKTLAAIRHKTIVWHTKEKRLPTNELLGCIEHSKNY